MIQGGYLEAHANPEAMWLRADIATFFWPPGANQVEMYELRENSGLRTGVWSDQCRQSVSCSDVIANAITSATVAISHEYADQASRFHLLSKLYERTSVILITNLSLSERGNVFDDAELNFIWIVQTS